jgi:hypothetical protein
MCRDAYNYAIKNKWGIKWIFMILMVLFIMEILVKI